MKHIKKINELFEFKEVEEYMNEGCIPFVVALKEIFPEYEIAVLNDEKEEVDLEEEYNYDFVHAFCYFPNDSKIIIDAIGIRKLKNLINYYHDINPVIDWIIPNSKYLIDEYAGKEFYSEESFEFDLETYEEAKNFIFKNINNYKI